MVCAFCLSSNFVLEGVDVGICGGINSGGVGGLNFLFLGGGGACCGVGGGGVCKTEGFVFKSVGGGCVCEELSAIKSK